jgi:uncharacterized membrane protein YedE/YeeE
MRNLYFLAVGMLFGITMFKSEAASWFRIYEMFQFDAFHMYGIIGSALAIGVVFTQVLKRGKFTSLFGTPLCFDDKNKSFARYLIGGSIFGLGWALAGACPGPLFTLLGAGFLPILVVIVAALFGTFIYGLLQNKLPH